MKVTATMPVRLGTKDGPVDYAEGESFEVDEKTAKSLLESGAIKEDAAPAAKKTGGKTDVNG